MKRIGKQYWIRWNSMECWLPAIEKVIHHFLKLFTFSVRYFFQNWNIQVIVMFFRMNIACQSIIGLVFMKSIVNCKYETFKGKKTIFTTEKYATFCRLFAVVLHLIWRVLHEKFPLGWELLSWFWLQLLSALKNGNNMKQFEQMKTKPNQTELAF